MKKLINIVKKVLGIYKETETPVYAGYATLYILMAVLPLLMLVVAAVNMMPGFSVENFTSFLFQFLPDLPEIQSLITNIMTNLKSQSSGLLASVAALTSLWSASSGVSAIQTGLKKITPGSENSIWDKPRALLFTFLFAIAMLSMLVFQILGDMIADGVDWVLGFLNMDGIPWLASAMQITGILTAVGVVLVIALMFTYLPGGKRTMKSQMPGAIFTAVLWAVFSALFAFFIPRVWKASAMYGSLTSIFLLNMWLKFIITILLVGAGLNRALHEEEE